MIWSMVAGVVFTLAALAHGVRGQDVVMAVLLVGALVAILVGQILERLDKLISLLSPEEQDEPSIIQTIAVEQDEH